MRAIWRASGGGLGFSELYEEVEGRVLEGRREGGWENESGLKRVDRKYQKNPSLFRPPV